MPFYVAFGGGWLDLTYGISGVWASVSVQAGVSVLEPFLVSAGWAKRQFHELQHGPANEFLLQLRGLPHLIYHQNPSCPSS
jgi:hypothetical protein